MTPTELDVIYDPKMVDARMLPERDARYINWVSLATIVLWCFQAFGGVLIVAFGMALRSAWLDPDKTAVAGNTYVFNALMVFGVALAAVGGFGTLVSCTVLGLRCLSLREAGYSGFTKHFRLVLVFAFCGLALTYLGLTAAILARKGARSGRDRAFVAKEVRESSLKAAVAAASASNVMIVSKTLPPLRQNAAPAPQPAARDRVSPPSRPYRPRPSAPQRAQVVRVALPPVGHRTRQVMPSVLPYYTQKALPPSVPAYAVQPRAMRVAVPNQAMTDTSIFVPV